MRASCKLTLEEWMEGVPWRRQGRFLVPALTHAPSGLLAPHKVARRLWAQEGQREELVESMIAMAECTGGASKRYLINGVTWRTLDEAAGWWAEWGPVEAPCWGEC